MYQQQQRRRSNDTSYNGTSLSRKRTNRSRTSLLMDGCMKWSFLGMTVFVAILLFVCIFCTIIIHWILPTTERTNNGLHSTNYGSHLYQPRSDESKEKSDQAPRIAIILPYSSGVKSSNTDTKNSSSMPLGSSIFPPYMLSFCAGAVGSMDLIDFFIFYIGTDVIDWPDLVSKCPSNVKFISTGPTPLGMAERLARIVDYKYSYYYQNNDTVSSSPPPPRPMMEYDELINFLASYIQVNPYALVEFKPALGYIFQDYIDPKIYTHWGYTDLDILFGDVSRWITDDELYNTDIFTYTFGDQDRLYLRGQLTVHKNRPDTINQLWRHCSYLNDMDERFYNIMAHKKKYRVESAEGCYSTTIFQYTNITVKFAVKAWTDIHTSPPDPSYTHGLFLFRNVSNGKQIIYKFNPQYNSNNNNNVVTMMDDATLALYNNHSIPSQMEVGTMQAINRKEALEGSTNHPPNCMYWVREEYQSQLCLRSGTVSSNETVYWKNGRLYKQLYENTMDMQIVALSSSSGAGAVSISTGPFFHFQEWKRTYRYGQLATLYPILNGQHDNSYPETATIVLTPEGAIPMIDNTYIAMDGRKVTNKNWGSVSPLGLYDMSIWHGIRDDNRTQLPGHVYCLQSSKTHSSSGKVTTQCQKSISWQNQEYVKILLGAPIWNDDARINNDYKNEKKSFSDSSSMVDVTLVLTLEIIESNYTIAQKMTNNLIVALRRWQGQPCVVVIYVMTQDEKIKQLLENKLVIEAEIFHDSTLIAIIYDDEVVDNDKSNSKKSHNNKKETINDDDSDKRIGVSRKALLNMAIDAVPTRWYVSGLELERGLSISTDTAYFAHQMAVAHDRLQGHVFWIPQFALIKATGDSHEEVKDNEVDESDEGTHIDLTLKELFDARIEGKVKNLAELEQEECIEQEEDGNDVQLLKRIVDVWWKESNQLVNHRFSNETALLAANRATILEEFDDVILELTDKRNNYDIIRTMGESPILLVDNIGPYSNIRTNEIVREVEEFAGIRCYNGLRMIQLAILGYTFDVLAGAYVTSSESSRRVYYDRHQKQNAGERGRKQCFDCPLLPDTLISAIFDSEIKRVAKTAILWAETSGDKATKMETK